MWVGEWGVFFRLTSQRLSPEGYGVFFPPNVKTEFRVHSLSWHGRAS